MKKQKKEIRAIIFDIGEVLYKENISKNNKYLKKYKNYYNRFLIHRKKYIHLAQTNKISPDKYFELISKGLGINKKLFMKSYIKARSDSIKINRVVERILIRLKKNYIIGTLTNITTINHRLRIKKKVYKNFNIKFISCIEGLRKPDTRFYKLMIKRTKFHPNEIIYIDNEKEFLIPAKKLGINTILYKNSKQLIKDLKKLGVKT